MTKRRFQRWKKSQWVAFGIWAAMACTYFLLYWMQGVTYNNADYKFHNPSVQWLLEDGAFTGYPGYQIVVGAVALLLGGVDSIGVASVIVLMTCALAAGYVTFLLLRECIGTSGSDRPGLSDWQNTALLGIAFLINIVQPIFTPSIKPGYISGNGYVSPTQLLCKPFALLVMLIFLRQLLRNKWTIRQQLLLLGMLALSCLAKPVFAMAFVPAAGLLLAFIEFRTFLAKKQTLPQAIGHTLRKGWPLLAGGVVLIVQYLLCLQVDLPYDGFMGIDGDAKIAFGWMTAWSQVVSSVPLNILFAYFFPLVTSMMAFARRKQNLGLSSTPRLYGAICLFYGVISFLYMSCLYQENHVTDANLRNAWVLTFNFVFILSASTVWQWINLDGFSLRSLRQEGVLPTFRKHWTILVPAAAFAVHILFGLALIAKNYLA